jgi:hypothetical protein
MLLLDSLWSAAAAAALLLLPFCRRRSSWNHFGMLNKTSHDRSNPDGQLCAKEIMAVGDALVESGLRDKGYSFVNIDGGWSGRRRLPNGTITVDPNLFPAGIAPVASYLHSIGLDMGIYTSRGRTTCGGWDRPGSEGYELLDAAQCEACPHRSPRSHACLLELC